MKRCFKFTLQNEVVWGFSSLLKPSTRLWTKLGFIEPSLDKAEQRAKRCPNKSFYNFSWNSFLSTVKKKLRLRYKTDKLKQIKTTEKKSRRIMTNRNKPRLTRINYFKPRLTRLNYFKPRLARINYGKLSQITATQSRKQADFRTETFFSLLQYKRFVEIFCV